MRCSDNVKGLQDLPPKGGGDNKQTKEEGPFQVSLFFKHKKKSENKQVQVVITGLPGSN